MTPVLHVIQINSEPVDLCKVFKFEGIAESGASAKLMISNEEILVNDKLETRKRKKLMAGDVISVGEKKYVLTLKSASAEVKK